MIGESSRRILAALRAHPGQGIRALHRSTGLAPATVLAHVSSLAAEGRIEGIRKGTYTVWTVPGRRLRPTPPHPVDIRIIEVVQKLGRCSQKQIMAALPDVPRSTIQFRLSKLAAQ